MDIDDACAICLVEVPHAGRGRPRRWCSDVCKLRARIIARLEARVAWWTEKGYPRRADVVRQTIERRLDEWRDDG